MGKKIDFNQISEFKVPEKSPGFLLWQVSTSWRSFIEETLKPLGLTHPQFVLLATLGWLTRNGDLVPQVAIGKMANLDPNTTSQIVKGLEQKGLIKREASSDGRAKNPFLTAEGKSLLERAMPAVEGADQRFFEVLNEEEMQILLSLFQKLAQGSLS